MKKIYEWQYDDNHSVKMPVATIQGSRDGPIFTVTSGMHAGEYSGILAGMARADTVTVDPHKWLHVPLDCGALLTRLVFALGVRFLLVCLPRQGSCEDEQ